MEKLPDGFVHLPDVIPEAIYEIRYFTDNNFVGVRIDGYEKNTAILTKPAAEALKKVSDELLKEGITLKIYDGFRPQTAVNHFVRWAENFSDTKMKSAYYPDVDKKDLFKNGYIAEKSGHSRGSTVDLTLVDSKSGQELDMGSGFDFFGEISHPLFEDGLTDMQKQNRMKLRNAMLSHGFLPLESEWWHFTLKDEPYPDTYFDFPVR